MIPRILLRLIPAHEKPFFKFSVNNQLFLILTRWNWVSSVFATNSDSHSKATPAVRLYRAMATDQAMAPLINKLLEEMAARPAIQTVIHNIFDEPIA